MGGGCANLVFLEDDLARALCPVVRIVDLRNWVGVQGDLDLLSKDNLNTARATVLYGINNRYKIGLDNQTFECVIKGKVLKGTGKSYAPLAPGDQVGVHFDSSGAVQIVSRGERNTEFSRWNNKRKRPQTMAANLDVVVCIASPESPPFRPRFIDRIQVTCEIEKLPLVVILNKADLGVSRTIEERLRVFQQTGCQVLKCSARNGSNINKVRRLVRKTRSVFVGQSGVGKTSVLNAVLPGLNRKVGEISNKYNRGTHTTRHGVLIDNPEGGWIVDTPGIREFEIVEIELSDLTFFFPDLCAMKDDCLLTKCTHDHEPGCAVMDAVQRGDIHVDRYESYLRILDSMRARTEHNGQP
ncbi:MAG: ribosome small subunit-dependent GTPase A [Spirochaetales bacterium]|nr:ribosome small subunit-dependent GTPase A [Spirochaetales bacterium]